MKKLNIFLADLEHNQYDTPQNYMPYAIGLIASYAKKIFGDKINVRLFKYPEKLHEALNNEKCDILGCSTYIWNTNISHWACRLAKKNNPNTLTVLGGPDFAKKDPLKIKYFKEHDYVDIRVAFEGEIAFENIIRLALEHGVDKKSKILSDKIKGCVYLNKKTNELVDTKQERIHSLNIIPSPYTTGLLDEFFDGHLNPTIQTSRGCPFKCNFCHESDDYFLKIKGLEIQYVLDDLEYIAKKMNETKNVSWLMIADSNFGMLPRDKHIAEKILEVQKKYNWPQDIVVTIGKNERIIDTTYMLKDMFEFTMSVQSMNQESLDATGRTNISKAAFKRMADTLRKGGRSTYAETIVPLPKETLSTFFRGMKELMDMKVQRIVCNTLMFLRGTAYEDQNYIDQYSYKSKFRLLPTQFGIYGGEKIFEVEEVGISTNTMNFEEYLETRKFIFIIEMLFNSKIFRELEYLLEDYKLNYYDYVFYVYKQIKNAPEQVKSVMESLEKQSISELKDTEEGLIEYYSKEDNFKKIVDGEEGNNLKFLHKALLLGKYKDIWLDFVFDSLKKFLVSKNVEIDEAFHDIVTFTKCKFDGVLDSSKTYVPINSFFNCDVINWLAQENRTKPLKEFAKKNKIEIKFIFNEHQVAKRDYLFKNFKESSKFDMANFVLRVKPQHKLFRNFEYADSR